MMYLQNSYQERKKAHSDYLELKDKTRERIIHTHPTEVDSQSCSSTSFLHLVFTQCLEIPITELGVRVSTVSIPSLSEQIFIVDLQIASAILSLGQR